MFISEEEARRRLQGSENLLNRVNREADDDSVQDEFSLPCINELSDPDVESYLPDSPEETDEGVLELVRKAIKEGTKDKPRTNLTKPEAADSVIVSSLTSPKFAAPLFDRHKDHLQHIRSDQNQAHIAHRPNEELVALIEQRRSIIRNRAYDRINTVLECLDDTKIESVAKPRELGHLASQLSIVADKMLPKEMRSDDSVHFHIFRPEVRKESEYEVVEVGDDKWTEPET